MTDQTSTQVLDEYLPAGEINRGKTKVILEVAGKPTLVIHQHLDQITGGDGARREDAPGKAEIANETNAHIMRLLHACGTPVAFKEQLSSTTSLHEKCVMIPVEVVVRRRAVGRNNPQRFPHIPNGTLYGKLVVELYLKTKDQRWGDHTLPCDDPYMVLDIENGKADLFDAHAPIHGSKPFLTIPLSDVCRSFQPDMIIPVMIQHAKGVFLILEKSLQILGSRLDDLKVEFGANIDMWAFRLADIIDGDSLRAVFGEEQLSKDGFRAGGSVDETLKKYTTLLGLVRRFSLPRQRIVLWRGSASDELSIFYTALQKFKVKYPEMLEVSEVTMSAHRDPVSTIATLRALSHDPVDTIVIAYAGRTNALGPMLAASGNLQIIAIAKEGETHNEDILSLLRPVSTVPVLVAPNETNAIHAALNRFSATNPLLYMMLQEAIEDRIPEGRVVY